jgi:glycosyltransferase involved in cell wall biosynthesis
LGEGFLFAGRLSREKGIETLLDAWSLASTNTGERLFIAGAGELEDLVRQRAAQDPAVVFLGQLSPAELGRVRSQTAVAVMPSLCFEAHPSVGESFALGRPVVATRVGALATVVDDSTGWLANPDAPSLADALAAASDGSERLRRGVGARRRYLELYDREAVIDQLLAIYGRSHR